MKLSGRRGFLVSGFASVAAVAQQQASRTPDRGPALAADLVKDFVIAGHGNLEKVQLLLEREPALARAAWDWGGGDFETALGGASHMGKRDIALFLLDHGARMDLFAAAMLGKTAIVRATLDAFPGALLTPGPHKIPLLAHARVGGAEAAEVLALLEKLKPSSGTPAA